VSYQEELALDVPSDPDPVEISVPALISRQPIGDLILANFPYQQIIRISYFDVRRRIQEQRDVERYLGIQRPLIPHRVADLQRFVNFADAAFPTAIIIAVDEEYATYDPGQRILTLRNYRLEDARVPSTNIRRVARVIDGQHRIAGLMAFEPSPESNHFDVPVTVFIGADVSDQAYVFSTVNLEQTKVSKNLAYDLYELARTRSPYKTCHNIAVALDREEGGPLFRRIKRLGFATEGRDFEPITQANFVDLLVRYISAEPKVDRDQLLRGRRLHVGSPDDIRRFIFRNMFISERDLDIARTVSEYFVAVRDRWPVAWDDRTQGKMLNRTNGFRALMRALRTFYLAANAPDSVVHRDVFQAQLELVRLNDRDFRTDVFPPGTTGESMLYRILIGEAQLEDFAQAAR
jgi:DGQHR domain-containing protein